MEFVLATVAHVMQTFTVPTASTPFVRATAATMAYATWRHTVVYATKVGRDWTAIKREIEGFGPASWN